MIRHLGLLACWSLFLPLRLLTELDDSETGFVSILRRKGEEIFSHILYKDLILIPG